MGDKSDFHQELSKSTGIPATVLKDPHTVLEHSVAQRMSWASARETTRVEDMAYCLLGIFDIQMPMLYGEGDKAFLRLQEGILKTTDDYTIFAWRNRSSNRSTVQGLLAQSPADFQSCKSVERKNIQPTTPISLTPLGLHIELTLIPNPDSPAQVIALIPAYNPTLSQSLAIHLICLDRKTQYARINAAEVLHDFEYNWPEGKSKSIYVRQKPSIPGDFAFEYFSHFQLTGGLRWNNDTFPPLRGPHLIHPPEPNWDDETHRWHIDQSKPETIATFLFAFKDMVVPIAVGFNRDTAHYWCKVFSEVSTYFSEAKPLRDTFVRLITEDVKDPSRKNARYDTLSTRNGFEVEVEIKPRLCGYTLELQVCIDYELSLPDLCSET